MFSIILCRFFSMRHIMNLEKITSQTGICLIRRYFEPKNRAMTGDKA